MIGRTYSSRLLDQCFSFNTQFKNSLPTTTDELGSAASVFNNANLINDNSDVGQICCPKCFELSSLFFRQCSKWIRVPRGKTLQLMDRTGKEHIHAQSKSAVVAVSPSGCSLPVRSIKHAAKARSCTRVCKLSTCIRLGTRDGDVATTDAPSPLASFGAIHTAAVHSSSSSSSSSPEAEAETPSSEAGVQSGPGCRGRPVPLLPLIASESSAGRMLGSLCRPSVCKRGSDQTQHRSCNRS